LKSRPEYKPEYKKIKQTVRVVTGLIIILLAAAITMGVISVREVKQMISEDFNAQQLALSKHAALTIEKDFKILKNELLTLSLSPSIQYVETVSWRNRMEISMATVREYGVFRILLIPEDGKKAYTIDPTRALSIEKTDYTLNESYQWCSQPNRRNLVYAGEVRKGIVEESETELVMELATSLYQTSPDEAHPVPTLKFAGVLVFYLDAGRLARQIVGPIRSGKTGYAWIIDQSGNFIYHLEQKFIGQNAFEARHLENPHISFDKINLIQKDKMLQGQQGTSWYKSGWHRGQIGPLEKLIAFSPTQIDAGNTKRVWSVAVVAPISEVQDAIQKVYFRQILIQLAFTIAVLIMLFFLRSNEMIWVKALEREVQTKTKDLSESAWLLKNSEKRYRALVESADDLIYVLDQQGKILAMNQSWSRLTHQASDAVLGHRITDIMEFENPDMVTKIVKRVIAEGYPISKEDHVTISDQWYYFDTRYKIISGFEVDQTSETTAPSVLVIARDVTESKHMEAQLFNTQKLASLGELSAGVAHEINNPIAIILGFTEMLLEKTKKGTREFEILTAIERQGDNCKRIVEKLLAFARISKKSTHMTNVKATLQRILDVVENTLLTKKIDLKTELPDAMPKVHGDSQELEQVFLNIINNAVAAMKGGGILAISTKLDRSHVQVDIQDTGTGIPPENIHKIFEPFFTTKDVGEGTGLGLSVSYGIVKKIGGDISVKNLHPAISSHTGALFTILLPIAKENEKVVNGLRK